MFGLFALHVLWKTHNRHLNPYGVLQLDRSKKLMRQHEIDFYGTGHDRIKFCKLCGKEGLELIVTECPGEYQEKIVDKKKEPD